MRILHVSGYCLSESNGVGRLLLELIYEQNKNIPDSKIDLLLTQDQILNDLKFDVYFYSQVTKKFFKSYDLVVFHGVYFLNYYFISQIIKNYNIPYLIKPHSSLVVAAQKKSYIKKCLYYLFILKNFINHSSGLIFTSEGERFRSLKLKKNYYIEPNGLCAPDPIEVFSKPDVHVWNFIYIGRIDIRHKGLDILFDSLFILKDLGILEKLNFKFYGKGNRKDEIIFRNSIKRLDSQSVTFNGPIYGCEKFECLSASDVFVLTSRYEGVPMAVLEALSQSVPCLVTPETNIGERVIDFDMGWVAECDPHSIANEIIRIINSPETAFQQKKENARSYVLENHSWTVVSQVSHLIFEDFRN
ncbi:glycosyltransferase [Rhodobacterales bacterium HKCCA1288]|nr:glycosyltransferase [Rhodobacterales bacterium HKCCA1288]